MSRIHPLADLDAWQAQWQAQQAPGAKPLLIFKKSPICPTSHHVEGVFTRFVDGLSEAVAGRLSIVSVDVVNQRPVSQRIAADTGVVHQSPQALLVAPGGKVTWHASHGDVDEEALGKAVGMEA